MCKPFFGSCELNKVLVLLNTHKDMRFSRIFCSVKRNISSVKMTLFGVFILDLAVASSLLVQSNFCPSRIGLSNFIWNSFMFPRQPGLALKQKKDIQLYVQMHERERERGVTHSQTHSQTHMYTSKINMSSTLKAWKDMLKDLLFTSQNNFISSALEAWHIRLVESSQERSKTAVTHLQQSTIILTITNMCMLVFN